MEKQLKDYLHLYLGCELIGIHPDDDTERKGYLTGIHGEYEAEIQFFNEDGVNVSEEPAYNMFDQIKLSLRPLSSMTMEELIELEPIISPEKTFSAQEREDAIEDIKEKGIDSIEFGDEDPRVVFELFRWFLSKHFDIFELIPAGLAIASGK